MKPSPEVTFPLRLPTVVRRRLALDQMASPCFDCPDCWVGEPHVCPNMAWSELVIDLDEWGGAVVMGTS